MNITITQCDMCGTQHKHGKDPMSKAWVQVVMQGISMVPVVALTRDLCPDCAPKFTAMWMGQWDFPPQPWNDDCKERGQAQALAQKHP